MNTDEKGSTIFEIRWGRQYIVFLDRAANANSDQIEKAFKAAGATVVIVNVDTPVREIR